MCACGECDGLGLLAACLERRLCVGKGGYGARQGQAELDTPHAALAVGEAATVVLARALGHTAGAELVQRLLLLLRQTEGEACGALSAHPPSILVSYFDHVCGSDVWEYHLYVVQGAPHVGAHQRDEALVGCRGGQVVMHATRQAGERLG